MGAPERGTMETMEMYMSRRLIYISMVSITLALARGLRSLYTVEEMGAMMLHEYGDLRSPSPLAHGASLAPMEKRVRNKNGPRTVMETMLPS